MNLEIAKQVAALLLQAGAVKLSPYQPFTWASGWKSPIYCDNRLTLSYPAIRSYIKNALAQVAKHYFPEAEAIGGVATAGIPQGTLLADLLELPFLYIRPKPKEHGMENLIEGKILPQAKVLLVEDLISTGGSSLKAAQAVRDAGMQAYGMLAVFSYDFDIAREHFQRAQVPLQVLCTYPVLLQEAVAQNLVSQEEVAWLQQWRAAPDQWQALKKTSL
ncbi:MAG: orotate phosphoribosyltransferase [Cytophagales bacterium]|nr:orotate phosphoribosyltransferase [Bernardetiaceae bacterium]MDW8205914.1 orotate phosphoribosyltransferase [Cytophagales bacterium]